jgi:hypothetical protein
MLRQCKKCWKIVVLAIVVIVLCWVGGSTYFHLSPIEFAKQGIRVTVAPILAQIYSDDAAIADHLSRQYWVGHRELAVTSPLQSWQHAESLLTGFELLDGSGSEDIQGDIPFVYESIKAPHLAELQKQYNLHDVIQGASDEYEAMLQLGAWIGTRWDHGTDSVPGGTKVIHPAAIIEAGEQGAKFWCEIAAKVTVNAATALGWPARLVTASSDGYTWEHAVAELWSNQYNKWFVIDTDFNIVYEANGVPLSAFELCHHGLQLQQEQQLTVRSIAEPKASLPLMDLLPLYSYVHIDLRNDWYSRQLRRGSPAGGDRATWWTARPSFHKLLTAKIRVDDQHRFNWHVNRVYMYALYIGGCDKVLKIINKR